jgi:dihydroorotate dehydrogenase
VISLTLVGRDSVTTRSDGRISRLTYRLDRSYGWNSAHGPQLPRRPGKLPPGPGGRLFDCRLNSPLGIAAGFLLSSKWVDAYAHLGFDILTYATVRSVARPAHPLPNLRFVENQQHAAVARPASGAIDALALAVSTGMPSAEPDAWRKDVRRARDRLGAGQILIVSVVGTPVPGGDGDTLAADYARCAAWAAQAGADAIEVHLACPHPEPGIGQMLFDDARLSAHVLDRVRAAVDRPVVAKLGAFRSPRLLHDSLTKLAPRVHGLVLVHGIQRRVLTEDGEPAFDGKDRVVARVVGPDAYPACTRQVQEAIAWRKAGDWHRAILAVGGITSVERAQASLREGADAVLVDTAALVDPLFAFRFRGALQTAA